MTDYEILEYLQSEVNKINVKLPTYQQVQMVNVRDKEFVKTSSRKLYVI
jgi:long-chain acyl-CoA synthetase